MAHGVQKKIVLGPGGCHFLAIAFWLLRQWPKKMSPRLKISEWPSARLK